jgi:hypothetical protein
MSWIRSHVGLIGISLLVGAMFSGASALTGTAASGLPLPFLLGFLTVLIVGALLERAAENALSDAPGKRR